MARILYQAREHGYQTVPLSFQLADRAVFTNLDTFLRWFCESIGRKLKRLEQLDDYWIAYGSKDKSTAYFEECLLAEITSPLLVSLDGMELIDFFHTVTLLMTFLVSYELGMNMQGMAIAVAKSGKNSG